VSQDRIFSNYRMALRDRWLEWLTSYMYNIHKIQNWDYQMGNEISTIIKNNGLPPNALAKGYHSVVTKNKDKPRN
jgi:hypothetical protein